MKAYHPKQANKGRMGRATEPCTRAKPPHQLYECQYSMMGYEDSFSCFTIPSEGSLPLRAKTLMGHHHYLSIFSSAANEAGLS